MSKLRQQRDAMEAEQLVQQHAPGTHAYGTFCDEHPYNIKAASCINVESIKHAATASTSTRTPPSPVPLWRRLLFWRFDALLATPTKIFERTSGVFWPLAEQFQSAHVAAELRREYVDQRKPLGRALVAMEATRLVAGSVIALVHVLVAAGIPFLLHATFVHITSTPWTDSNAMLLLWRDLLLLSAALMTETVCLRHEAFNGDQMMARVITALQALVFESALGSAPAAAAANPTAAAAAAAGANPTAAAPSASDVVQLIDHRAVVVGVALGRVHRVWRNCAVLAIELSVLVHVSQQRVAFIVTTLAVIATALAVATTAATAARQQWLAKRSALLATVHASLRGIRQIKLSATERRAQAHVDAQCKAQDTLRLTRDTTAALVNAAVAGAAQLFSIALLASMALDGDHSAVFTPAAAFTVLALLQRIRLRLLSLAQAGALLLRVPPALHAIATFLHAHDAATGDASTRQQHKNASDANTVITIDRACFTFTTATSDHTTLVLVDVTLVVPRGQLVVVYGASGAGKTTLLRSLVRDVAPASGIVALGNVATERPLRVAYCAQTPWLPTRSVRDSVLMDAPFDAVRYAHVLAACGLLRDIAQLPLGDATIVMGPNGANLSSGQRARLALARACYADADVYVLDAPLATVDAVVQTDVFRACLLDLLRYKTIVVATHNPEMIRSPFVDQVVLLHGRSAQVTVRTNSVSPSRRVASMANATRPPWQQQQQQQQLQEQPTTTISVDCSGLVLDAPLDAMSRKRIDHVIAQSSPAASASARQPPANAAAPLESDYAPVPRDTLRAVFGRRDVVVSATIAVVTGVSAAVMSAAKDVWLAHWVADASFLDARDSAERYAVCIALALACAIVSSVAASHALHHVASDLFTAMTQALLAVPIAFFDATPLGKVLYRYFIDLLVVDDDAACADAALVASIATLACRVAVVGVVLGPIGAVLTLAVVGVAFVWIYPPPALAVALRQADLPAQWQNLDYMLEALDGGGAATIRAFGRAAIATSSRASGRLHDTSTQSALFDLQVAHCVAIRASVVVALQLLAFGATITLQRLWTMQQLSPVALALALFYSMELCASTTDVVHARDHVQLVLLYASRIRAYTALASESSSSSSSSESHSAHSQNGSQAVVASDWPLRGAVQFDNVSFRYGADASGSTTTTHDALTNVSFTVASGARVGVIGRTGSGKSSLALALVRLHPLASGRVLIDGVDTRLVDLQTLRSRITIISEAPVLYRGTVRQYLDPFSDFSDAALWRAVHACGLDTTVQRLDQPLDTASASSGTHWSVGERQALSLVRALLKPARILVLDEAFSGLDHARAASLLAVLERAFAHSTVFVATHRLEQVLTFEQILVLGSGRVLEAGSALELASDPHSTFYEFLETTLLTE